MRKEIYIKKIEERGKIKIFIVDGFIVRRDLDEEFTNFGQHFRFKCIPKYEFWLDKEASPDERKFFIDHLLIEWQLMKDGISYNKACDKAQIKEKSEREELDKNSFNKDVHIKLLGKTGDNLEIWVINGKYVRNTFDIEFTEGGHGFVYNYVPKNQVWIDNDVTEKERDYVILHELFERSLMEKGYNYESAHKEASKIEIESRRDKKILKNKLKKFEWKN